MRIVVVVLAILNLVMIIWGGLGYWYSRGHQQGPLMDAAKERPMPGYKLVLLRERQQGDGVPVLSGLVAERVGDHVEHADSLQKDVVGATQGSPSLPCLRLGPFKDAEAAGSIVGKLSGLSISSSPSTVEKVGGVDYWVYIQPQSTRELALAKLRELQDKKIDSFVIPQGDLENGISLGVYDNENDAIKKQQEIAQQGYEAKVAPHDRKYMEHWVRLGQDAARSYTEEINRQVQEGQVGIELHKEPCAEVAPMSGIQ